MVYASYIFSFDDRLHNLRQRTMNRIWNDYSIFRIIWDCCSSTMKLTNKFEWVKVGNSLSGCIEAEFFCPLDFISFGGLFMNWETRGPEDGRRNCQRYASGVGAGSRKSRICHRECTNNEKTWLRECTNNEKTWLAKFMVNRSHKVVTVVFKIN